MGPIAIDDVMIVELLLVDSSGTYCHRCVIYSGTPLGGLQWDLLP